MIDLVIAETNRPQSVTRALAGRRILNSINWIERNFSFEYMSRFGEITIEANSTKPGPYKIPPRFKSVQMVRHKSIAADGTGYYLYLTRVDSRDLLGVARGTPLRYWIDGMQWIWFDSIPSDRHSTDMQYYGYTRELLEDEKHWLLENGEDVVLGKTMELLAPFLRMPELLQTYRPMLDEGIRTLLMADEEQKNAETDVYMGMYGDRAPTALYGDRR
jgi:hypothetical protein